MKIHAEPKQNVIEIGLLGCHKDPLMLILNSSNLEAISGSHCGATGYQPPMPEYMIAILYQLADINNSTSILSYHKVCVAMGIDSSLQMNLNSAFFDFVHSGRVVAVVDVLKDENSLNTQNIFIIVQELIKLICPTPENLMTGTAKVISTQKIELAQIGMRPIIMMAKAHCLQHLQRF